jgi:flagellar biosynthesis/type III secretory pathway chaperone
MLSSPAAKQFSTLLDAEIACLQSLLAALEQERQALKDGDLDSIEQATAAKHRALGNQQAATLARQDFATLCGIAGDTRSLRQQIATSGEHLALNPLQDALHQLAARCHDLNRANGRLIHQKQENTRTALGILRQTEANPTYSSHGDTPAISGKPRTLGKA